MGGDVFTRGFTVEPLQVPLHKVELKFDLVMGTVAIGIRPFLPVIGVQPILGTDLLLLLLLCYCVNFACEDCTQGEGDLYNYKQIHIHRLSINFLKVSIEVTSLIWLGKLFQILQACGPKENL